MPGPVTCVRTGSAGDPDDQATVNSSLQLKGDAGRYTLYVVAACPFAARPWVVIRFYGLEHVVQVVRCWPGSGPDGWFFEPQSAWEKEAVENHPHLGSDKEPHFGAQRVKQLYEAIQPGYAGRFSIPLLFDKQERVLVSNDSMDIAKALCSPILKSKRTRNTEIELLPDPEDEEQTSEHDALLNNLSSSVTNGPYMVVFGQPTQSEHERQSKEFLASLDKFEERLCSSSSNDTERFLMGKMLLADIILFNTAARWDIGYRWRFNIGGDSIHGDGGYQRYPATSSLVMRMLALPGMTGTDGAFLPEDIATCFYISTAMVDAVAKRRFCRPLPPQFGWRPSANIAKLKSWGSGSTTLSRTATDHTKELPRTGYGGSDVDPLADVVSLFLC